MRLSIMLITLTLFTTSSFATSSNQVCGNSWRFPGDCLENCTYILFWHFRPQEDSIKFAVISKYPERWTGVGFTFDRSLANSDAIFGWFEETGPVIMDAFLPTYAAPVFDATQSVSNISAEISDGLATFQFTRKRNTSDKQQDLIFSDDRCPYFIYPVEGGTVDIENRRLITGEYAPHVSERRICIKSCSKLASPRYLSPSNDLGADIDSSPPASSGSAQQNNGSSNHKSNDANPFSRLAFLTEPSLRWLAGIGCVATLLAMIVFQACFTVYKNKQACKHNLYSQSALKPDAFIANGTTSIEGHQSQHLSSYTDPQSSSQPRPYPSVHLDMTMTGGYEESSILDELEDVEDTDLDYKGYFYHNQHLQQPPHHNHRYPNQQIEHASYRKSADPCRRHHQHLHHYYPQRQYGPRRKHPNNHQRHLHDYHRNPYYVQQQQQPLRAYQPSRSDSYFLPSQRRYWYKKKQDKS